MARARGLAAAAFPQEALDRYGILPYAGTEHFESRNTTVLVFGSVNCRSSAFTDVLEKAIPSDGAANEVLLRHWLGKVLAPGGPSKTGPT